MGGSQFTKTLCTGFSQTPENDNGRSLIPAGWEAGPNHHGHYGTGFSIFSCTQQPKNLHLKPAYFLQYLSIQDISLQSQSQ